MPLRWIIMGLAAAAMLAFIWYRNHRGMARLKRELEPGRGIADEAATAFEDAAAQVIQGGDRGYRPDDRSKTLRRASDLPRSTDA